MGFFSHLFYPWGFILQIAAVAHFFWRRRAGFVWLWIIFIGGFVGAAAYFIVEVFSEADLLRAGPRLRHDPRKLGKALLSVVSGQG